MEAKSRYLILLSILAIVILASGCTGLDPQALATANPMIQQFLDEHPNAKILVTHFTAEQAKNMIDQIRSECDNPYIDEKEFYRVNITDAETDFYAVVWIDWNTKVVECAYKLGTEGKVIEKPKREPGCESHASYKCDSGHLYWFDSCGNMQEKRLYCKYGCSENQCLGECRSQAEYRCYGDHLYWFDSCGNKQEKKEYCNYGCNEGFCKPAPAERTCEQAGGYCVWPAASSEASSGGGGGGQAAATGMVVATETTATSTITSYQCGSGYAASPKYFCKEGGICCLPETTPIEFCGSSTQGPCASNSDCVTGGCSGQVCQSVREEPIITTCEYKDCYNADKYGMACKCIIDTVTPAATAAIIGEPAVQGRCKWTRTIACTEEAKICPDGTSVGRTDPNCEFAPCPTKCGNGICEDGEADYCPPCTNSEPACMMPCAAGTCPKDCTTATKYYRNAYWQCYDGMARNEGGESSCKSYSIWRQYAEESCNGRCIPLSATETQIASGGGGGGGSTTLTKCGVSSFSVFNECSPVSGCRDSDGGINHYIQGTATASGSSLSDHCNDAFTLTEKFCAASGAIEWETYTCPNGCKEGACVDPCPTYSPPSPNWCMNGTIVSGGVDSNGCQLPPKCMPAECALEGQQFSAVYKDKYPERCCEDLTAWNSGMDTSKVENGVCVLHPELQSGYPVGTCIKCGDGTCGTSETVCNCPQDCKASANCTDTDGGKNYYVKGSVSSCVAAGCGGTSDQCQEGILTEIYCKEDKSIGYEIYQCPSGCSDGACISRLAIGFGDLGVPSDWQYSVTTLKIILKNYNFGQTITITNITTQNCSFAGSTAISVGGQETFQLNGCAAKTVGESYSESVTVIYSLTGGLPRTVSGTIAGIVE